jgi:hypothetical protein
MNFVQAEQQAPSGKGLFAVSSGVTVIAGISLLGLGIYALRPAPATPAPVVPPPQVIVQKEYVPTPVAPAPKPPVTLPVELPAMRSPPPVSEPTNGPWVGVWKMPKQSLPMLHVQQKGTSFHGEYAPPDWSGTYPFQDGVERDGKLEFAVTTPKPVQMCGQFRLELLPDGDMRCENWMKPEDALAMLTKAAKVPKTPAQAAVLKLYIDREIKRLGKPVVLGTFRRIPDPGDNSDHPASGTNGPGLKGP